MTEINTEPDIPPDIKRDALSGAANPGALSEGETERLRVMFEQAPGFFALTETADLVFKIVNQAYYQLVGNRELIGRPAREAVPEMVQYVELAEQVYASGEPFVGRQMPVVAQHAPNAPLATRYIDFVFQPLFDQQGGVFGVLVQGHDVTEQKYALDALQQSNERWMFAIEGARDGVWDWNVTTGEVFNSRRYFEILGYEDEDGLNTFDAWSQRVHPEDVARVMPTLRGTLNGGPPYNIEYRLRCKNGDYKWVLSRGVVVVSDSEGRAQRLTGTLTDISEKKEQEDAAWHSASIDHLTGLPNRRLFRDRLERQVRQGSRKPVEFALLFIDLDRFKEVNDLRGHDTGDQLLVQVAARLAGCVRNSDTVARLGGDEFTVLLPDLHGPHQALQTAQKLVSRIAAPFHIQDEVVHLSASIGITLYPQDATEPEDLIRNADQAMYAAKHAGRNQYRLFTKAMKDAARQRVELLHDLRGALKAHQLEVYYQPIVDLATGAMEKAEALLRWNHPRYGAVSPTQFIPLAEESGLIHQIGDWVFEQASACAHNWSALLGRTFQVTVNCSPVQVLARSSAHWPALLATNRLTPGSLAVEITEGILLKASPRVADVLAQYRAAGIQVALDDFGTGYSALSYLTQFEIDFLKIDKSFIQVIDAAPRSLAIVESIIAMAHKLGLRVIAEGIESHAQKELLQAIGCDLGQGYLFSTPRSPDDFTALVAAGGVLPASVGTGWQGGEERRSP
jgi:diguanylate cyclase (GGDEF)-like protein/PAS domain S-box-containing protein